MNRTDRLRPRQDPHPAPGQLHPRGSHRPVGGAGPSGRVTPGRRTAVRGPQGGRRHARARRQAGRLGVVRADLAFGWSFAVEGPYSIITTGPGHPLQGGIQDTSVPLPAGTPSSYAVPCLRVADVAGTCATVAELGGAVVVPATPILTGLVYAFVADPAGNMLGLFTPPELG